MEKRNRLVFLVIRMLVMFLIYINIQNCKAYESSIMIEELNNREVYINDIFVAANESATTNYRYIEGISISSHGSFLIVFSNGGIYHYIDIYDSNQNFVRSIELRDAGSILAFFDEGDHNIVVYAVRRGLLIKIENTGKYISSSIGFLEPSTMSQMDATEDFFIKIEEINYCLSGEYGQKVFSVYSDSGSILGEYKINNSLYFSNKGHNITEKIGYLLIIFVAFLVIARCILKSSK